MNIEKIVIDNILKIIEETTIKKSKNYVGETPYSGCVVLEGYMKYLKIKVKHCKVNIYTNNFKWSSPELKAEIPELTETISKQKLTDIIIPELKERISDFVLDKANEPMFRHSVNVILEFDSKNGYTENFFIEDEKRKLELRDRMNNYIEKVIFKMERPVKNDREQSIFSGNLVNFNLMDFSPKRLIEILEQCFNQTFKKYKEQKV